MSDDDANDTIYPASRLNTPRNFNVCFITLGVWEFACPHPTFFKVQLFTFAVQLDFCAGSVLHNVNGLMSFVTAKS